jgi:hypothetical protein
MNNKSTDQQNQYRMLAHVRIPFTSLLYNLMFNPSIFLVLQNRKVLKSLYQVMGFGLIATILLTLNMAISMNTSFDHWEEWLSREIQEFGITKDKTFFWKHPQELPYMTEFDGWRIDITTESILQKTDDDLRIGNKGFWITGDSIYLWVKTIYGSGFFSAEKVRIEKYDLGSLLLQLYEKKDELIVKSAQLADLRLEIFLVLSILMFWSNLFSVHMIVLLFPVCSSVFAFLFSFLQKSCDRRKGSFRKILVLNLYATIPPLLIATIYALFGIPGMNFFTVFFIAFLGYQFYIMKTMRTLTSCEVR